MNILITGGASGLGLAITLKMVENPANTVFFTYCHSQTRALELERQYANCHSLLCDYTKPAEVSALLNRMGEMDPDVLVNCAYSGGIEKQHFHKGTTERFENDFNHNILPVIRITQEAIQLFRKKKSGRIITVLSAAIANRPPVGWSQYVAGKNYLHALSKSWAVENAAFNISANCVSPAFMQTALTADTDERVVEEMLHHHPLKKLLAPVEVADAVYYFANCSPQVNGVNLFINAASDII